MHVDRVDLSAIQPMDVGATLPSDGCPQLRERHGPFHSTPPLVGSKRGIRNEHGRLDFRPFLKMCIRDRHYLVRDGGIALYHVSRRIGNRYGGL